MKRVKKPKTAEPAYTLVDYQTSKAELLDHMRQLIEQTEQTKEVQVFLKPRSTLHAATLKLIRKCFELGIKHDLRLLRQLSARMLHYPAEQPASVLLSVIDKLQEEGVTS